MYSIEFNLKSEGSSASLDRGDATFGAHRARLLAALRVKIGSLYAGLGDDPSLSRLNPRPMGPGAWEMWQGFDAEAAVYHGESIEADNWTVCIVPGGRVTDIFRALPTGVGLGGHERRNSRNMWYQWASDQARS